MMISVIVPVALGELLLEDFLVELLQLPDAYEILLVSANDEDMPESERWRWIKVEKSGRALALNAGAAVASHDWLWFVHADSRNLAQAAQELEVVVHKGEQVMYYFDLNFYDGSPLLKVSAWGAKWRSRLFGAPFGDQAFCVPRVLHERVGGYREDANYGEDHLYARALRTAGVRLVPLATQIGTSARMHIKHGWLKVVCKYQWRWISQALRDRKTVS